MGAEMNVACFLLLHWTDIMHINCSAVRRGPYFFQHVHQHQLLWPDAHPGHLLENESLSVRVSLDRTYVEKDVQGGITRLNKSRDQSWRTADLAKVNRLFSVLQSVGGSWFGGAI